MDTSLRPKQAKRKAPLQFLKDSLGPEEEFAPIETLKSNLTAIGKGAAKIPENLYDLFTDPTGYTKKMIEGMTTEQLGQAITGGFGPNNVGGFAGSMRAVKGSGTPKPSPYTQEVLPAAERAANLEKMQAKSAAPGDWYHGTSRDIKQFKPKQAGATFITRDPKFAEGFAEYSQDWMAKNARELLTPEQLQAAKAKAIEAVKETYLDTMPDHQKMLIAAIKKHDPFYENPSSKYFDGEALDFLNTAYKDQLPSAPNILKVHTSVENPWDYANPEHLDAVAAELNKQTDSWGQPLGTKMKPWLKSGSWPEVEKPVVQDAIRALGHDSFYTQEGSVKNLGVYDPANIKSAYGNEGTYDTTNPEINKKDGGTVKKISRYSKQHIARDYASRKK